MGLLSSILKLFGIGITGKRETGHPQRINASMPSASYPPYRAERDARYFAGAKAKLDRFRVQASVADQMVLDTETTGNSNDAKIIEIGAILIRDNLPIAEYEDTGARRRMSRSRTRLCWHEGCFRTRHPCHCRSSYVFLASMRRKTTVRCPMPGKHGHAGNG